jgi:hypothetical protein
MLAAPPPQLHRRTSPRNVAYISQNYGRTVVTGDYARRMSLSWRREVMFSLRKMLRR